MRTLGAWPLQLPVQLSPTNQALLNLCVAQPQVMLKIKRLEAEKGKAKLQLCVGDAAHPCSKSALSLSLLPHLAPACSRTWHRDWCE